jgi:hypothetical protein
MFAFTACGRSPQIVVPLPFTSTVCTAWAASIYHVWRRVTLEGASFPHTAMSSVYFIVRRLQPVLSLSMLANWERR